MGRTWPLNGPDEDWLSFNAIAEMFGYEPDSLRKLIASGHFPAPRGFGSNQFYSGEDVAAIRLLLGRWQPAEKTGEERKKPAKAGENRREEES